MISFSNIKAETLDSGTPDRSVHVSDYIIRLHNLTAPPYHHPSMFPLFFLHPSLPKSPIDQFIMYIFYNPSANTQTDPIFYLLVYLPL